VLNSREGLSDKQYQLLTNELCVAVPFEVFLDNLSFLLLSLLHRIPAKYSRREQAVQKVHVRKGRELFLLVSLAGHLPVTKE
jgi:hypothetical protein